jgi:hypothetical protein
VRIDRDWEGKYLGQTETSDPSSHTQRLERRQYADFVFGESPLLHFAGELVLSQRKLVLSSRQFSPLYSGWHQKRVNALLKDEHKFKEEEREQKIKRGDSSPAVQVNNHVGQAQTGGHGAVDVRYEVQHRHIFRGQLFTSLGHFTRHDATTIAVSDRGEERRPFVVTYEEPHVLFNVWRDKSKSQAQIAAFFGVVALGLVGGGIYNRR